MKEIQVTTTDDKEACWSVHEHSPIVMLHSDQICAQWGLNHVGICVIRQPENVKIEVHNIESLFNYQSFYFKKECFEDLLLFFRAQGFPCYDPNPFGCEEE